ncbi:MAG: transcriptional repressor LexA [Bacilli bacterium]
MKNKLTTMQGKTLDYIKRYIADKGFPPTVREICEGLGLSSPATVHTHLKGLTEKGYIKKNSFKNRAMEVLVANEYIPSNDDLVVTVPLLGKITAGNPIEAIENPNETITLPQSLVPKNKEVFTLNVEGESMINAGIFDGDIIIIERCNVARNGEIVVAMNEDYEVTLKTFYKEKDHFRLQPENDLLEPIILSNVSILGKAIGLFRQF